MFSRSFCRIFEQYAKEILRPADFIPFLSGHAFVENQRQGNMNKHNADEEKNIENDEGNQFVEKVVDSEKHCSVISPKNVLRVSYAEILKQPIRKPQSCEYSASQVIAECDFT